ncbi:type I pantothenate kinase [Actinomycetaceae bacterium WB03_NA08]|uniref:Pantothenate kinase n=1 Tax=Scrofimicrobium canadense TaxID=2652290 RepID=A0A6N7W5I7_9ACTO|nr:type I pantothenate kinase [Scrofimicrobium canadense]MSS83773.1 type I pantothenate kinase [Scrofimicrobium canadense]
MRHNRGVNFLGKHGELSPFEHFTREQWSALATRTPLPLTALDIERLASLGDPIDLREVDAIYRPLSAVLQLYVDATRRIGAQQQTLIQQPRHQVTPFIIGVAGSVAVGKSTVSRLLRLLLSRWPRTPRVDLVTTDGFLYPNSYLEEHGLMGRKGFPESYDRTALLDFVARIKSGQARIAAPVYSHVTYDIVPGKQQIIDRPNIVIIEGLNVLQPARTTPDGLGISVADFFDFRLFVDADPADVERWYIDRFLQLRTTAFSDPDSYFTNYAGLSDNEAVTVARGIWRDINLPNLIDNIEPTKPRATLVLRKSGDHRVEEISLRKT